MQARKLTYHGRVQGVGFRYSVKQMMSGFDASGYVRNVPDGTVELWIQGEPEEIAEAVQAIQESHLKGHIQDVDEETVSPDLGLKGFSIF